MNSEILEFELERYSFSITKEFYLKFKRVMDFCLSFVALVILSPIFLIIGLLVKSTSKGSIIYKHKRVGKDGKDIYLYKFRTMVSDASNFEKYFTEEQMEEFQKNYKLDNDPRITKVGQVLRMLSLDELPQLFNILKGDMALIGPRPVIEKELEYFKNKKEIVLAVLPGLTGWWACNGRSCTTYAERVQLEAYYAENISFKLDVKCFFRTIKAVIERKGAK